MIRPYILWYAVVVGASPTEFSACNDLSEISQVHLCQFLSGGFWPSYDTRVKLLRYVTHFIAVNIQPFSVYAVPIFSTLA